MNVLETVLEISVVVDILIGMIIISFGLFTTLIGIAMVLFSARHDKITGVLLIGLGLAIGGLSYICGKWLWVQGYTGKAWWHFHKVEAFFADLGALLGVICAIGLLFLVMMKLTK